MLPQLGQLAWSLLLQLITEKMMKQVVLTALKAAAASSKTSVDDDLVKYVEEAWGEKHE